LEATSFGANGNAIWEFSEPRNSHEQQ